MSANVFKYSFIHGVLSKETRVVLVKGSKENTNYLSKLGYRDISAGNLYSNYFYVLLDTRWWLNKSAGDDFLSSNRISEDKAISFEELKKTISRINY